MSKALRRAVADVLESYDAYCTFWDDDGISTSLPIQSDLDIFQHQQVTWSSLDELRVAYAAEVGRRHGRGGRQKKWDTQDD